MKNTLKTILLGSLFTLSLSAAVQVVATPIQTDADELDQRPRKCFVYVSERQCNAAAPRCLWIGRCIDAAR